MPSDDAVYWRDLPARDRQAHADEAGRALALENEQLRLHNAELSASLVAARDALEIGHRLLEDQSVAIAERDDVVGAAERRAVEAEHQLAVVLSSRRWRATELLSRLLRAPRAVLARLRRQP
ncbi:hypothetical protein FHE66_15110 [Georgenia sp. 311]|uniref:Uncharacterized protein n=1 Tax=Georgenia wutianyii TaxID=2585135 RepID=A0ABX5VJF3_9MICO|nr:MULTISPECIES: hypothetical protein [Georgenia]QDB78474.1 hypothetical protein FE251_03090 [Georgenia wutianyii]TNC16515.1 hypothetical protein FHE66_15110 [Georgenia sp. 311]